MGKARAAGGDAEALAMFQGELRALVRQRAAAAAMRWNEGHGEAADLVPTLAAMGALGALAGEAAGGAGLGVRGLVAVLGTLGAADAGLGALVAQHALALAWAERFGLLAAVAGAAAGAPLLCLADGRASCHLDDQAPAFELRGGGLYGAVGAVLGGRAAQRAVVVASDAQGAAVVVVALGGGGLEVAAAPEAIGLRSCPTVGLRGQGCAPIAVASAVGKVSDVEALRALARLSAAQLAVATARASHEGAVRYSLERQQFGKPIATLQPIQWQTADSETELWGAELLVARAAAALDVAWLDAHAVDAAADAVDRAAIAAFEAARRATDRALQLHGGYGYTTDYAAERPYRDVYALPLLGGSAIAARARVAARLAGERRA